MLPVNTASRTSISFHCTSRVYTKSSRIPRNMRLFVMPSLMALLSFASNMYIFWVISLTSEDHSQRLPIAPAIAQNESKSEIVGADKNWQ